jgi:hypothetical protein
MQSRKRWVKFRCIGTLRTELSWEINRLSRIRRSHSEVPDDRILKSEAETGCLCMCLWASILDMVEIECSFPVKDETPRIYSEIRVWMCPRRVWPTYNALTALTRELIHNMSSQGNGNPALISHVVYQFTAQTRRHIHTRISEHMGVSPLTENARSQPCLYSIIHTHKHMHKHPVSASDLKILSSGILSGIFLSVKAYYSQLINPVL